MYHPYFCVRASAIERAEAGSDDESNKQPTPSLIDQMGMTEEIVEGDTVVEDDDDRLELVRTLVAAKCSAVQRAANGYTAMHFAAEVPTPVCSIVCAV